MYRSPDWSVRLLSFYNQLTLGAVLLLGAMLIITLMLIGGLRSLVESLRWQERAHEVSTHLHTLDKLIGEATDGGRAAESPSLSPHLAPQGRIGAELTQLRELMDDAEQATRVEQVRRQIAQLRRVETGAKVSSPPAARGRKLLSAGGTLKALGEARAAVAEIERAHAQRMATRRAAAEQASTRLMISVAILSLLISAAAFIGSRKLAWRILEPINQMMLAVEHLAKGDFAPRVAENTRDEVGQLARAFNRMAERVSEREAVILARNRELDELHDFNALLQTSVSEEEVHRALLQKVRAFDLVQALILDRREESALAVVATLYPLDRAPGDEPAAQPRSALCRVVRAGKEMVV